MTGNGAGQRGDRKGPEPAVYPELQSHFARTSGTQTEGLIQVALQRDGAPD